MIKCVLIHTEPNSNFENFKTKMDGYTFFARTGSRLNRPLIRA